MKKIKEVLLKIVKPIIRCIKKVYYSGFLVCPHCKTKTVKYIGHEFKDNKIRGVYKCTRCKREYI